MALQSLSAADDGTMMAEAAKPVVLPSDGIAAPLRFAVFRRIWLASLLSNLGLMIQSVGAAWAMTQMTASADKVALVQTALMLPIMLISMPAGAVADMYDRRVVSLASLVLSLVGACVLTMLDWTGHITPNILLAFCFIIGSGMALFGPAWQSSVGEQVPPEVLPSAVALNGISYNIARSFGPAIGGIVVATAGAVAAFAANAVLYIPLLVVLFLWRRKVDVSRLPRERLSRAIVSGVRYIANSPSIKIVLTRTLITGICGGSVSALMPLVARDLLHGGAQTYGIMLGAFGMGAVIGAMNIGHVRKHLSGESRDPGLCADHGRRDCRRRGQQRAGAHGGGAGGGRLGLDAGGRAVQYRRTALGAALGRRTFARRVPGLRLPAASRLAVGAGGISQTWSASKRHCWCRAERCFSRRCLACSYGCRRPARATRMRSVLKIRKCSCN
jgi:MFS family permease